MKTNNGQRVRGLNLLIGAVLGAAIVLLISTIWRDRSDMAPVVDAPVVTDPSTPAVTWTNVPNEFKSAYQFTLAGRRAANLPPSKHLAIDVTGGLLVADMFTGKIQLVPSEKPIVDPTGLGASIMLEPTNDVTVLYFIVQTKGTKGPVYRVDLETGKITTIETGGAQVIVSPTEDALLFPNESVSNESCAKTDDSCRVETTSFTRLDLASGKSKIIGQLPNGYSYAAYNYPPNQMASALAAMTMTTWDADGKISSEIYQATQPLNIYEPARKALKTVTFTADQATVTP